MTSLRGTRVVIAGAGLAGLTAALELSQRGATVHVIEARARPGGRVRTVRDADGFHAEDGGEFIDHPQTAIRRLAASLGLRLVRVLRTGFGLALHDGRRTTIMSSATVPWHALTRRLAPIVGAYRAAGATWDGAAAAAIARQSVGALVPAGSRPARVRAYVEALRGFYLAEPDMLSALVLVDQVASGEPPGRTRSYRVRGGNDRLIEGLVRRIRGRLDLGCVVRRIVQDRRGVRLAITDAERRRHEIAADYAVVTLPPPLVAACTFDPPLPTRQRAALGALTMGEATKVSLRFERAWWRRRGRPHAFGSNLPCGAVWESGEEQHGPLLTVLGGASTSAIVARAARDPAALAELLRVFGPASRPTLVGPAATWEHEQWSAGAYAVFGPTFDPRDQRLLSAAHGRVLFAGEHTSRRWQGFMNGAVESGEAAARDLAAIQALTASLPGRAPL